MIKLSNGYELEFVAASGALGFDGKGYWNIDKVISVDNGDVNPGAFCTFITEDDVKEIS